MADVFVAIIVFLVIPGTFVYFVWMVHASRRREALSPAGHCENCGYDLRESHSRCPECGRPVPDSPEEEAERISRYVLNPRLLNTAWPDSPLSPRVPSKDERGVTVYSSANIVAADLLKQHIEARGVPCLVIQRSQGARYHLVVVPEADKQLAKDIVDSFRVRPLVKPVNEKPFGSELNGERIRKTESP